MAPHSSTLAWKIPWMEEPGGLQSMGSLRVGYNWATSLSLSLFYFHALEKEMATHSSVLAWRIPGMREPGGLLSMGSHRVGHDWSDLAAVAWPIVPQYRNSHSQVKHGFHWLSIQCAITGPTLLTAVKSLWTSCPTSLLQLKKWLLLVFSSHI